MSESNPPPYRFRASHLHWLSLDVVAGAVVSHIAANRMPTGKQPLNAWVTVILGLVVLGIYTLDHLLDNRKPEQPRTQRHAFIREHEAVIWRITLGSLGLAALLSWLIPRYLWEFGLGMVILVALYLWGVSRIPMKSHQQALKEPITSLIYAAGVWGSTWFLGDSVTWESIVLGIIFYLITVQSLLLFSHIEAIQYREVFNMARWLKRPLTLGILKGISLITLIVCLVVCFLTEYHFTQRLSVLFILMSLVHYWMVLNPEKVVSDERFRLVGELVFIMPGLVL
ncbi:hypothetical protein [Salmonirosea aquatica]|uniref:Prenyltransferase n=1 Tax=Salmonirosea aquatica TaxID=2654236 RepID=A0A7C9B9W7_9BACT|nr:hypothetical protein [Cytophagaceae bacterium SJW1-29]